MWSRPDMAMAQLDSSPAGASDLASPRLGSPHGAPACRRVFLLAPALLTTLVLVAVPLGIMAYISLLQRGDSSGVSWESALNLQSYRGFLWEEDFDGTMAINAAYLMTFVRSVGQ